MKGGERLSARERVEAALAVHQQNHPGAPISVSEVCRQAIVSRANLYEHHNDLVDAIRNIRKSAAIRPKRAKDPVSDIKEKLKQEIKRADALYFLCIELQTKVRRLEKRIFFDKNENAETRRDEAGMLVRKARHKEA